MDVITTGVTPNSEAIGGNQPESEPAQRLDALEQRVSALEVESAAAQDLVRIRRNDLGEVEYQLAIINDPNRSTKGLTADELAAERFEAEANVSRAKNAYKTAAARSRDITRLLNIARRHLRRCQLQYQQTDNFVSVTPKPIKGDAEERSSSLRVARIGIERALIPKSEVKAELMAQVDRWASEAKLRIGLGGRRPTINVPVARVSGAESVGGEIANSPDPRPWLALLHRDVLEAQIDEALNARYAEGTLQLSDREKKERLAKVDAEILDVQRHVCAEIWASKASLDFPPDASPVAILGIEGRPVKLRDDD